MDLLMAGTLAGGAYLLYKGGKYKNWGLGLIALHAVMMYAPKLLPFKAYSATQNTLGFGGDGSYHLY